MSEPIIVKCRCTSPACRFTNGVGADLDQLSRDGCEVCGCKRIEIFDHPRRGHLIIDFASPKSRRKQKRKEDRVRLASLVRA